MLAARWWGRRDVRVEHVPEPDQPGPGWVTVKIAACGICGTDVEEYTAGPVIVPTTPHPLSGRQAPLTLGHEPVGTIVAAGPDVELALGTLVAVEGIRFCGECWWCRRHQYQLCEKLAALGLMDDGGLAEALAAPAFMCLPVDSAVDPAEAILAEPLSVAVRAVRRGGVTAGSSVGVVGTGTVGLLTVQAARLSGAHPILAVEGLPARRRLAESFGAVAVEPERAAEAARDLTGGIGLDVTFEAAGNPAAARAAALLARKAGRVVLLGVYPGDVSFDMLDLLFGEKEIVGSLSHVWDEDFSVAVGLINRGQVRTAELITDRIGLDDVVEGGFAALLNNPAGHLKIAVLPNGKGPHR